MDNLQDEKVELVRIGIHTDGGTMEYITKEDFLRTKTMSIGNSIDVEDFNKMQRYYLDNRFNSLTKGELIDNYSSENAVILNKNNFVLLNESDV